MQEEVEEKVASGEDFALLLVDLDRFKAFNDHYGFPRGDQVIQELAQMMQAVVTDVTGGEGFVGHLGGDDFVVVVPSAGAALVADTIVSRFDQSARATTTTRTSQRGWIEVLNRRGEPQRYEAIAVSIGVASTQRRTFAHFAEVMAIATEMKNFTKTTPGLVLGDRPPHDLS